MAEAHRDEIAKLEALYAANPEGRVFTHLAEAYRKAGELERAVEVLEAGLQRHPESASAFIVLGRVRHDQGDRAEAGQAFRRALELDNGNLVAHRYLADMAVEDDAPEEALRHYRELLNRSPGDEQLQQRIHALSRPEPEPAEPETPTLSLEEPGTPEPVAEPDEYEPAAEPDEYELAAEPVDVAGDELPGDLGALAGEQYGGAERAGDELADEPQGDAGSSEEATFDGTAYGDLVLDEAAPADTSGIAEWQTDEAVPDEDAVAEWMAEPAGPEPDAAAEWIPDEAGADEGALDFSGLGAPEAPEGPPELVLDVGDLEPVADEASMELPLLDLAADPVEGVLEDEAAYPLEPEPDWTSLEPAAEGVAASPPGLATETMAELYRTQGFHGRAAEVYRSLLRERGEDERLRQRLAEVEALAEAGRPEPDPESIESAFTGGGGAAGDQDTPYAWAGRDEAAEAAEAGAPIRDYFRSLLGWQRVAAGEPEGAVPQAGGMMEPPAARVEAPAWPVIEQRQAAEAESASELVLEDAVEESGWTPEEIRLERSEPMPWDEPSAATPPAEVPPTPPSTSEDLMPWDLPEPPGLEAAAEEPTEWPQAEPAAEAEPAAPEASGDEDEDLEMFRSWLQSLKK